ncbi:MAG: VanZ family protein [Deltaproteobacteria bacterium]|jgi:VanZ family protein|nr:VanZ family protein [Deltaproteobacteria bacterium]
MMTGIDGKVWRAWLAVVLCITAIWIFSGESFSAASTSRFITPFLRWLDPDISYQAILRTRFYIRKAAHLTEYAVLAVLAFRALRLSLAVSTLRVIGLAMGVVVAVAALDELRQAFLATRTGSLADVAINFTGGALGVGLIVALHRWLGIGAPVAEKDP